MGPPGYSKRCVCLCWLLACASASEAVCSGLHHLPALLWSFPGSGNTYVRQLMEAASGLRSGSIHYDYSLVMQLPGEAWPHRTAEECARFSCIKAHAVTDATLRTLCDGHIRSAILLVRHPLKAIWSDYQRIRSRISLGSSASAKPAGLVNEHAAGYTSMEDFNATDFACFARTRARQYVVMVNGSQDSAPRECECRESPVYCYWDQVLYPPALAMSYRSWAAMSDRRHLVVRYEDLLDRTASGTLLQDMMRMMGGTYDGTGNHALVTRSSGALRRQGAMGAEDVLARLPALRAQLWEIVGETARSFGYDLSDLGKFVTDGPVTGRRGHVAAVVASPLVLTSTSQADAAASAHATVVASPLALTSSPQATAAPSTLVASPLNLTSASQAANAPSAAREATPSTSPRPAVDVTIADLDEWSCSVDYGPLPAERLFHGWEGYRLGDCLLQGRCHGMVSAYPDSLAARTIAASIAAKDSKTLLSLAASIIRAWPLGPGVRDSCVIHLRVGDVIDCDAQPLEQLLHTETTCMGNVFANPAFLCRGESYVRSLQYYSAQFKRDDLQACRTVVVVAGSHWSNTSKRTFDGATSSTTPCDSSGKSMGYLAAIRKHLCTLGPSHVALRLGQSPDDDLVLMARSRVFIPSGGGFSRLAVRLRDMYRAGAV